MLIRMFWLSALALGLRTGFTCHTGARGHKATTLRTIKQFRHVDYFRKEESTGLRGLRIKKIKL